MSRNFEYFFSGKLPLFAKLSGRRYFHQIPYVAAKDADIDIITILYLIIMTTHVLSLEDQKSSLSAKKKIKKLTIRNVLSNPYKDYWFLVTAEEEAELKDNLRNQLTLIKPPKVKIPWKVINTIPKKERASFCKPYNNSISNDYKSHIAFGVNEITKLLEKEEISSILISAEVDPKFLVKHIIDMCVLQEKPVLLLPGLKDLLQQTTGLKSLTIGFKLNSKYTIIDSKIKEIYKNYKPAINQISLKNTSAQMKMDVIDYAKLIRNVHLHRISKNERVFKPELSVKRESTNICSHSDAKTTDFISFGDESIDVSPKEVNPKTKVSYKALLLKRVINNKNRDKKKIQWLKAKSK
ncbi:hypothetical protein FQA39_LY01448 [Lamprigera yunnana]|nr:hypothetical protein FQA39_LY01448 [Lamprigera yunnana]